MISELSYITFFEDAVEASRQMHFDAALVNSVLTDLAKETVAQIAYLLAENQKDLLKMDPINPNYDRLKLTGTRIESIANDMLNVAKLDNPLGLVLSEKVMPNGLHISKVTVPLGVVGVIYEARPNVTFDVFALCFKTGNVCVLKGGSDADYSNKAIIQIIHKVLAKHGVSRNAAILMPPDRAAAEEMFNAVGYIDVLIPRGSQALITQVRQNSKVPVIETGAGIVHTYFDASGDLEKGASVIVNAKTRRVSVCNALDCLLCHSSRLKDLPQLTRPLFEAGVEIYADERSFNVLGAQLGTLLGQRYAHLLQQAQPEHYGTEFLSMRMAIKTVDSLDGALQHIATHGSKHSEAIITEHAANAETFLNRVDAAAVYVNASTAFTDGAQFGLGAEIGISTQKLHARGPMGLNELTSYKWLIKGHGQTRP